MNKKNLKLLVCCSLLCSGVWASGTVNASTLSEFRARYAPVEQAADPAISNAAESAAEHGEQIQEELDSLTGQLASLEDREDAGNEDLIRAISVRLKDLETELRAQADLQLELMQLLESRYRASYNDYDDNSSRRSLVNPMPYGENTVSYTQDAANAQGNSTMTFSYAPDQLYKIYCRTGYLTDIELKKGEQVSFVGGGDTSSWAVNATTVNGVPHIYVKPVVQSSTTNMIITTNKRSYQLLLTVSDWYNPMVRWSYGIEEAQTAMMQNAKDEQTIVADLDVVSIDKLHSSYKVSVKGNDSYKPEMIFDDGAKTIIRMNKGVKRLPALFVREPGKKDLSLANFKTKDSCYIIDRVIDRAELRYSENDIVTIERRK